MKDIAVLTNEPTKCDYYRQESENVKGRFYCSTPPSFSAAIPNTESECNKTGVWTASPAHGSPPPVCLQTQHTRDNHLGNALGDTNPPSFLWTIPETISEHCVLRIRYNISTGDNNVGKGLTAKEAHERGFVLKTNPSVALFKGLGLKLNLAVNTQQFGRVFQDRSFAFAIRQRPEAVAKDTPIANLNVRGKRGNIVQVYPAVEYDFVPNRLELGRDAYVHVQWTGSNSNPNNNDGQGLAGTDRSNVLLLGDRVRHKADFNSSKNSVKY